MKIRKPTRADLERRNAELEGEVRALRSSVETLGKLLAGPHGTIVGWLTHAAPPLPFVPQPYIGDVPGWMEQGIVVANPACAPQGFTGAIFVTNPNPQFPQDPRGGSSPH